MRKSNDITAVILKVLKDGLLSTNQIKIKLGVNWHTALSNLSELEAKDMIERIRTSNGFFWKLKNGGSG